MKANKKWRIRITNLATLEYYLIPSANKQAALDTVARANDLYRGRYLHEVISK